MAMSTLSEEGVMSVKQTACDRLLNFRVEMKVRGEWTRGRHGRGGRGGGRGEGG